MSGFRRGLMANAKPNWRNFATDPVAIPITFVPATLYDIDYEVEFEFETFSQDNSDRTILNIGSQSSPWWSTSFSQYSATKDGLSFCWYNWGFKANEVVSMPKSFASAAACWFAPWKSHVPPVGRYNVKLRVVGDTAIYTWNDYFCECSITRDTASGLSTSDALTCTPKIDGHIFKITIKDLTNNRMLLDVPRSYLTK